MASSDSVLPGQDVGLNAQSVQPPIPDNNGVPLVVGSGVNAQSGISPGGATPAQSNTTAIPPIPENNGVTEGSGVNAQSGEPPGGVSQAQSTTTAIPPILDNNGVPPLQEGGSNQRSETLAKPQHPSQSTPISFSSYKPPSTAPDGVQQGSKTLVLPIVDKEGWGRLYNMFQALSNASGAPAQQIFDIMVGSGVWDTSDPDFKLDVFNDKSNRLLYEKMFISTIRNGARDHGFGLNAEELPKVVADMERWVHFVFGDMQEQLNEFGNIQQAMRNREDESFAPSAENATAPRDENEYENQENPRNAAEFADEDEYGQKTEELESDSFTKGHKSLQFQQTGTVLQAYTELHEIFKRIDVSQFPLGTVFRRHENWSSAASALMEWNIKTMAPYNINSLDADDNRSTLLGTVNWIEIFAQWEFYWRGESKEITRAHLKRLWAREQFPSGWIHLPPTQGSIWPNKEQHIHEYTRYFARDPFSGKPSSLAMANRYGTSAKKDAEVLPQHTKRQKPRDSPPDNSQALTRIQKGMQSMALVPYESPMTANGKVYPDIRSVGFLTKPIMPNHTADGEAILAYRVSQKVLYHEGRRLVSDVYSYVVMRNGDNGKPLFPWKMVILSESECGSSYIRKHLVLNELLKVDEDLNNIPGGDTMRSHEGWGIVWTALKPELNAELTQLPQMFVCVKWTENGETKQHVLLRSSLHTKMPAKVVDQMIVRCILGDRIGSNIATLWLMLKMCYGIKKRGEIEETTETPERFRRRRSKARALYNRQQAREARNNRAAARNANRGQYETYEESDGDQGSEEIDTDDEDDEDDKDFEISSNDEDDVSSSGDEEFTLPHPDDLKEKKKKEKKKEKKKKKKKKAMTEVAGDSDKTSSSNTKKGSKAEKSKQTGALIDEISDPEDEAPTTEIPSSEMEV